jgi:hypothetical protein
LLPPTDLLRDGNLRTAQPGAVAVPGVFTGLAMVQQLPTPGAVQVGGVMNTLDSTRNCSESNIVDEPEQPAADRATATMPSVLHLVAELVPETDDVEAEVERLRKELQLEREERENTVLVVASSAEPMVEENNFTKRKRMIYRSVAVFVVIGVAVAVAVGVTSANNSTTPSPMSRTNLFLEALLVQDPDLEVSALTNSGTPQFQALSWLAFEDPLDLDPETATGRDILERFVLATIFFATKGDNWRNTFKFLQKRSVCLWNNGEPLDSGSFGGISCNRSGRVANLIMGKLFFYFMSLIRLGTATDAFSNIGSTKSTNRLQPAPWLDSHRTMAAFGFGAY